MHSLALAMYKKPAALRVSSQPKRQQKQCSKTAPTNVNHVAEN
jgi:hypothetical protein